MALPLQLLAQLPANVFPGAAPGNDPPTAESVSVGFSEVDALLPDHGLLLGAVTELSVRGGGASATTLALGVCRSAQEAGRLQAGVPSWCAFVDASASLYAPGVARAGLALSRLLVVRPDETALGRVAVRLAESQAFSVLVVDLAGVLGRGALPALGHWPRLVRRLSMAIHGTRSLVLLLTRAELYRPLPLPVAQRLELCRLGPERLSLQVVKDRQGRIGAPSHVRAL